MPSTLELPLTHHGRPACMYASSSPDGGWTVSAEVDGELVWRTQCATWQRVERLHALLQHTLEAPPGETDTEWRDTAERRFATRAHARVA